MDKDIWKIDKNEIWSKNMWSEYKIDQILNKSKCMRWKFDEFCIHFKNICYYFNKNLTTIDEII